MKCRKRMDDAETRGTSLTWDQSGGCPDYCPDGIRHEGGVTLHLAFAWNVGTCRPDDKGEIQVSGPHEDGVPKRDTGAEQPVVGVKVRKADWTEGVALFGSQMRSTSNGRIWAPPTASQWRV